MKKNLINELLERDNTILKSLHDAYDFDFNAEYKVAKINGRFTHKSILKTLGIKDCSNLNIVLVLTGLKYQENNNYIAKMNETNFSLSYPRKIFYGRVSWFWGVGQFEEARKSEEKTTYIIYQSKELMKISSYKKPDYTQRFEYIRHIGWGDGRGRHGISQIDLKDLQHNGRQINIKTIEAAASTNINYYIDKSGYLIEEKKQELKRKAKQLKKEREKNLVDLINYDNEIEEIKKEIFLINRNVALKMGESFSFEDLARIDRIITKIKWFYIDFERFQEANNKKQFSSVERANNALLKIKCTISEIKELL